MSQVLNIHQEEDSISHMIIGVENVVVRPWIKWVVTKFRSANPFLGRLTYTQIIFANSNLKLA